MRKNLLAFWFLLLIALDYLIPYTILKGYQSFYGVFLFWSLLTIMVAASCFILVLRRWKTP